jgi:hypothetical protein
MSYFSLASIYPTNLIPLDFLALVIFGEKYTKFWWESPRERDHSDDSSKMGGWDQNGS